jgi:hypothetical protein
MWSRRSWVPLAVLAVTLLPAQAGWAHHHPDHTCTGDAGIGGGGGEAGGECDSSGGGGGDAPECDPDSTDVAYYDEPPENRDDEYLAIYANSPPPEGYHYAGAYNCAGVYLGGPHLVPDPDWVDIQSARDLATVRVTPPLPAPNVSPSEAVVNFPTWLWVDDAYWQPTSATASQGAVTVRVDARPVRTTWELDEGAQVCKGPGIPWSEEAQADYERQPEATRGRGNPTCTYQFEHSSTVNEDGVYHAQVTVTWEFSWWLNGIAQGVFGMVDRTSDFDLRVGEIQALITNY